MEFSQNHLRVIAVGLYTLEKSLERVEETLTAGHKEKITYKLNDYADDKVRNTALQDIEQIRNIIRDLKNELKLQPKEESITSKVRGEAAHMWERLCDLGSSGLNRYGETPKDLADFLGPRVEELIEITLRIQNLMRTESNKSKR
jgi:hypothetical protein